MIFTKRSKNYFKHMIFNCFQMRHNLNMGLKRLLFLFLALMLTTAQSFGAERIGVLYDAVLFENNPYSAYISTPTFLAQDIVDSLRQNRAFEVVPLTEIAQKLRRAGVNPKDVDALRNLKYGYHADFNFLKRVSRAIEADKLVIVTQSVEFERDFLKTTGWVTLGLPGDVINPTQRVNIYAVLVDTKREVVLWEEIFAKNIRNNKFKNLDSATSPNWEGMMRLKQYSKYTSPEIAKGVTRALAPATLVVPTYTNKREELATAVNKKIRIGSNKKLKNDNTVLATTFTVEQVVVDATKRGAKKFGKKVKGIFVKTPETPDDVVQPEVL
jgi:hypothetical protein